MISLQPWETKLVIPWLSSTEELGFYLKSAAFTHKTQCIKLSPTALTPLYPTVDHFIPSERKPGQRRPIWRVKQHYWVLQTTQTDLKLQCIIAHGRKVLGLWQCGKGANLELLEVIFLNVLWEVVDLQRGHITWISFLVAEMFSFEATTKKHFFCKMTAIYMLKILNLCIAWGCWGSFVVHKPKLWQAQPYYTN